MSHTARRITDENGVTHAYEYRNTIIEHHDDVWVISGFGPEFHTEHPTLAAAKAYIDHVIAAPSAESRPVIVDVRSPRGATRAATPASQ